jgi:hypothetical protein
MAFAPHTPQSLRALMVQFALAITITCGWWRLGLPIRGISRKDGPLPNAAKWVVAVFLLALFHLLAFVDATQRKQMGLPIF